jgi:4'-phosphopantetheinyl transferase EntD
LTVAPLFSRATPFGRLVGVALPGADDRAAVDALAGELPEAERALAAAMAPVRRVTWVGGRLALRAALEEVGGRADVVGATDRGAPVLPDGFVGSISHKATLAVALAARASGGATLGVDVELERKRNATGKRSVTIDISDRVLTERERAELAALPEAERARAVLTAFAAKEAIYKALDPWVRRYVAFQEVELPRGAPEATLNLKAGEGPFTVEVREEPEPGLILAMARVARRAR